MTRAATALLATLLLFNALLCLLFATLPASADYGGGLQPSVVMSSADGTGQLYVWQYNEGTRTAARLNDWPTTSGNRLCLHWTENGVQARAWQERALWLPLVVE